MSDSHDRFACPGCGKRFRWNADIAGRKVRCTQCNLKMRIPQAAGDTADALEALPAPELAADDGGYDLSSQDDLAGLAPPQAAAPSAGTGKCPSCNTPVKPQAVICINCGFNLQAGKKIQTRVETDADAPAAAPHRAAGQPLAGASAAALAGPRSGIAAALENREDDTGANPFIELWLPLALILVGLAFNFAYYMYFSGSAATGAVAATVSVGVELVIQVPLLLIALVLAAKILDVSFGSLGTAVFKLVAVALGPSAIGGIVSYLIDGGGLMGWFLGDFMLAFILFWILLTVLFDLEGLDTLYLILIIWAVQWLAGFLVVVLGASMFF